jgi:hypothetical protein
LLSWVSCSCRLCPHLWNVGKNNPQDCWEEVLSKCTWKHREHYLAHSECYESISLLLSPSSRRTTAPLKVVIQLPLDSSTDWIPSLPPRQVCCNSEACGLHRQPYVAMGPPTEAASQY